MRQKFVESQLATLGGGLKTAVLMATETLWLPAACSTRTDTLAGSAKWLEEHLF